MVTLGSCALAVVIMGRVRGRGGAIGLSVSLLLPELPVAAVTPLLPAGAVALMLQLPV